MLTKNISMKAIFFALLFSFFVTCVSLNGLSLEEKIGQMLIVHFQGEIANEDAKTLIQQAHVGGFIFYNFSNGLNDPTQVNELSSGLQNLSTIPLFIAVDQEGGRVQRLKQGFTPILSALEIAKTKTPEEAEHLAYQIGLELKNVGINMNFAPVVDVNTNPLNPVIGNRSFGNDPETVIVFARSMSKGYQKAGMIPVLKHFPGHGDTTVDSHLDLPIVNKSKEDLSLVELKPFQALAPEVDGIMTAHILMPAIDSQFPATVSKNILEGVLKKDLNFQGLIISDSLVMEGILTSFSSIEEAAIAAIQAGCDLLVLGGRQLEGNELKLELTSKEILKIHQSIFSAAQRGIIPLARIDEAVAKIMHIKQEKLMTNDRE